MVLFDNELTIISIGSLSMKGYQFAYIKSFDSAEGAEKYFLDNFDVDRNGIKK